MNFNTKAEKLKFLRSEAAKNGLTFKQVNVNLNGNQGYALFERKTGYKFPSVYTIDSAFLDQMHSSFMSDVASSR